MQRNRKLADALNIDPESHTNDHIPYSDATLKMFRENINWAQTQEREFRVFAAAADKKRLRFKPMPKHQRAFLHYLAADFGFESASEDPEPHRHVSLFKTPKFVSAPYKTLAQCLRIISKNASDAAAASSLKQPALVAGQRVDQSFNAFLLRDPRFGLTIEEVEQALAAKLAALSGSGLAVKFTTSFLPSDEVVVKAAPVTSAASIPTSSPAGTPQSIENILTTAKPAISRTISRLGLAGTVVLCHADSSLNITRTEGDSMAGGWSAVVSRGKRVGPAKAQPAAPAPRSLLTLKRAEPRRKEKEKAAVMSPVEDDWLTAAEKLALEEDGEDSGHSDDTKGGASLAVGELTD